MSSKLKDFIKKILFKSSFIRNLVDEKNRRKNKKLTTENFNKNGTAVIGQFFDICNELDVECWLVYGTLLGCIRENGLIKHDYDFDVGMWKSDFNQKLKDKLLENGFILAHQFEGIDYDAFEQTYQKDGVSIDIFYSYKNEAETWTHVFHREKDEQLPPEIWKVRKLPYPNKGLTKTTFLGKQVFIPSNAEEYLALTYGDNWRIPDSNFDWKKGPYANSILPGVFGKMTNF